jgi:hypothetical protein
LLKSVTFSPRYKPRPPLLPVLCVIRKKPGANGRWEAGRAKKKLVLLART